MSIKKSIYHFLILVHVVILQIKVIQGEIYFLDTKADLNSDWIVNCNGYYQDESFICTTISGSLIPEEDRKGNDGFWTPCNRGDPLPECSLTLKLSTGEIIPVSNVGLLAYIKNAEIDIHITSKNGTTVTKRVRQDMWTDLYNFIDISSSDPIMVYLILYS